MKGTLTEVASELSDAARGSTDNFDGASATGAVAGELALACPDSP